jgi:hypothetical protein
VLQAKSETILNALCPLLMQATLDNLSPLPRQNLNNLIGLHDHPHPQLMPQTCQDLASSLFSLMVAPL